jgi:hypothetical protein
MEKHLERMSDRTGSLFLLDYFCSTRFELILKFGINGVTVLWFPELYFSNCTGLLRSYETIPAGAAVGKNI